MPKPGLTNGLTSNRNGTAAPTDSPTRTRTHAKTSPEIHVASLPYEPSEIAEHLALAARATNDAIRHWDLASGTLSWLQGLQSLLGYTPSMITDAISFWQRHLHPDDRTRTAASIQDALARRDAERWSGEYRFRKTDGTYLVLLERAVIVRDKSGKAQRWVGSLMDITASKALHDQLCRSQRMEAFGQLAGGVAHDFNNFLTAILGYSDLLLSDAALKRDQSKHVAEIRNAAKRASALTSQLLAFSRKHPLDARVLEVNALINHLERSILRLLGENITVQCELHRAKEGLHIRADREQMTQIILNLVVNARDAMPNGGRLCLTSGTLRIDGENQSQTPRGELAPGDYVSISVRDDGIGMTPEVQARLFEPFFTTKDGAGSGLGLATSYGIVRQSRGQICVESAPLCGTTVTIYLPRVAEPEAAYKKPGLLLPGGSETVLVVEDDIGVRHLAVRVLRGLGYDVIEAASGDDAQRLVAGNDDRPVDLVVIDIVMPQMSGHRFADWLRGIRPEAKVVFISGYLDESLRQTNSPREKMYFLPKPFDPAQLASKVREALDAKG
ncbi:MAG TPA: ATP-binding protein [Chthoniobacterales bacterium]